MDCANGNYEISVEGLDNKINLSEGDAYVVVDSSSVGTIVNGNNCKTTVLNMGEDTYLNNCDKLIKSVSPKNIQAGIHSDKASVIEVNTGYLTGMLKFKVSSQQLTQHALKKVDKSISAINSKITLIGAQYNRLSSAIEANAIQSYNVLSSKSTLKDADVADVSSKYIANLILQQSTMVLSSSAKNLYAERILGLLP